MRVLFDTCVWVRHFREADPRVQEGLENDLAVSHPMVLGELILGRLPESALSDMTKLELLPESTWAEVVEFVFSHKLQGAGLSWIDAHLLHACLSRDARLVTDDRALKKAYDRLRRR